MVVAIAFVNSSLLATEASPRPYMKSVEKIKHGSNNNFLDVRKKEERAKNCYKNIEIKW